MKKTRSVITLLIIIAISTYLYFDNVGNVRNAVIDYGESEIYTTADIDEAIKVVFIEFKTFKKCKLTSIGYAGDKVSLTELEYIEKNYDECIVLVSSFHTSKSTFDAFEPDTEYKGWKWILGRKKGGQWELVNFGFA